ncbi:MAG: Smr/MutS family protein [Fibrobacterota bacterium]|nr:Smr/MutS family protein [Fibrobacterota bacterium]
MGNKGKKRRGSAEPNPVRRIETPVDEEIDLHGLAIDEAMVQVELALARWGKRPGACLRIIHGQSSGTRDSIKGALRRNLESSWKNKVRSFRQEFANPGSTLVLVA